MKKVLVAGGAGFIGTNLCKSLLDDYEVVCIDDFSSGQRKNLEEFKDYDNFSVIEHNIIDPLPEDKKLDGVEYVYNLASRASPPDYQDYALHTIWSNTKGNQNLLEYCKKANAKFLYTSTSEVYGDPLEHPQKETYRGNVNPFGIRSCYDESKRLGETIVYIYLKESNVDARVVRIFNTYGPYMKPTDGRVVSNFICQALRGEDITIYGDGSQTRSFCYVSDMVDGLRKAMFTPKTKGEVINLGNPDEFTIIELAQKVLSLIKTRSTLIHKPLPLDDPTRRNPDITKARKLLGWEPRIKLNEGLKDTIPYFGKELRISH